MSGIPLFEALPARHGVFLSQPGPPYVTTHIARPVPEDEAREAVVAAARGVRGALECTNALRESLDRLDALTNGDA